MFKIVEVMSEGCAMCHPCYKGIGTSSVLVTSSSKMRSGVASLLHGLGSARSLEGVKE